MFQKPASPNGAANLVKNASLKPNLYQTLQTYHNLFGVCWPLRKFEIAPNAYYNFLKNRKVDYGTQKQEVLEKITEIYHEHNGVDG